jgi:hypothetical protein
MERLRHLLYSQNLWTTVSSLLVVWIIYAIGSNAVAMAQHNPIGFLSLASPLGLTGIFGLIGPGFIPGILLYGALTMRNISRIHNRRNWTTTYEINNEQLVQSKDDSAVR